MRNKYNILVGHSEGKKPLARPRHSWEYNIKIDLGEIVFWDVDWIHVVHNRDRWWFLVNTVINIRVL
jgi:hypothetical protein